MITLYTNSNGTIRTWSITPSEDELEITYGTLGGKLITKVDYIAAGKQGRTQAEQVLFEMQSRINKQKDKGYVASIDDAIANKPTNTLGHAKPMLAQKYGDVHLDFSRPVFVQRKYDGNRCIIHNTGSGYIAYSRNGKQINSIDHILGSIRIPVGMYVDGELYAHGHTLQEIVSWIKRKQENTSKLKYHAYDLMLPLPFSQRFELLHKNLLGGLGAVEVVPTWAVSNYDALLDYHAQFRSEGFEGTIIRTNFLGYEDGKRSKSLVKLKDWNDEEFKVVDIVEAKDGWGILICSQLNGPNFRVVSPGTHEEKIKTYQDKANLLGKYVTVEFAYRTADGVPFHPCAKGWRN